MAFCTRQRLRLRGLIASWRARLTIIELESNFLGSVREGNVAVKAQLFHGSRTTQVWDAQVMAEATDRALALFRCTQMILYPKA